MDDNWSWFAEIRDKPVSGPAHQSFRDELWIGGTDHACRYYLSMLTNRDYFALPLQDLWRDLADYVVRHASPGAIAFAHQSTPEISDFALPYLVERFQEVFGIEAKLTKEKRGMVLLLKHPEWSDEQIRVAVRTTEKQMARWAWFQRARAVQRWYQEAGGR